MNLRQLAATAARIARDVIAVVAEAPAVHRELQQRRTEQAATIARIPAPLTADDVKGEVPDVEEIEQAAREFEQARVNGNAAARIKRAAEKILGRTPDGVHGQVTVERFESSRLVADLDAIKAIFASRGLGDVPMKRCAASLTLTWAQESAENLLRAA
jgi:hypothetical protein